MKKNVLTAILILPLLASCNQVTPGQGKYFKISDEDLSLSLDRDFYSNSFNDEAIKEQWDSYGIGDPFVYRFNGMYYLYVSTKNNQVGVRGYKSSDLVHWTPCQGEGLNLGYVSDDPNTLTAYAPEVMYWNGYFYMVESKEGHGHYLLRSESPEGPFHSYIDNFIKSIDGSFFIDDDEKIYFLSANNGGIRINLFNDDLTLSAEEKRIINADIGGWTEGPYLLKKDGNYLLTFTGTNVTSPGYHVSYAYHSKLDEESFFNREGFIYGNNLILSTKDDFNGLGHSSTVLGPNLDSYYLAYHSLETSAGPKRRFCIDRLFFNETEMECGYYGKDKNIAPELPTFSVSGGNQLVKDNSNIYLSNKVSEDIFTSEYNYKNSSTKCLFSYVDNSNYGYVVINGNKIELHEVKNGNDSLIKDHRMNKTYDFNKLHTVRVAYSYDKLDVYFDTMHMLDSVDISLNGGKVGYIAQNESDIYFTAFSNSAHDSSQKDEVKQSVILATDFLNKYSTVNETNFVTMLDNDNNSLQGVRYLKFNDNKTATYKVFVPEDGYYGIDFTLPQESMGKKVEIRVDNEEYQSFVTNSFEKSEQDYTTNVGGVAIPKGIHYLTVAAENNFTFRNMKIFKCSNISESFVSPLNEFVTKGATYVNTWKIKNGGHYASSGNRQLLYFGDDSIRDSEVEVKINFDGETFTNTAGIILRADNAAFSLSNDADSIQGYYVGINNNKVFIRGCDYNQSSSSLTDVISLASGVDITLKAKISGNTITCFVNGELKLTYNITYGPTHGHIGLYTDGCAATYKDLTINVSK